MEVKLKTCGTQYHIVMRLKAYTVPHGSETENLWDIVQCGSETFAVYVFPFQGVRDMLKVFLEKCQEIDKLGSKSISFLPQLNIISEVCLLHRT